MVGEDDGALQTCSEAKQAIGTTGEDSEGISVLLESVRSSGDDQKCFLLTGAAGRPLSSPKKKGDDGVDSGRQAVESYSRGWKSMQERNLS